MAGPANATSGGGGRLYTHPVTGETATSVTTILGGGIPKPALTGWAAREAATYAVENAAELARLVKAGGVKKKEALDRIKGAPWRQRDDKADLGTATHDVAEAMGLGDAIDIDQYDERIRGYLRSLSLWWDAWQPRVEMTEATVWSREWGYAGTLDLIADVDMPDDPRSYAEFAGQTVRMLIDYKTSKGVYGETALQLVAYERAEFVLLDDGREVEKPPCALGGVVHIQPDGKIARFHPVRLTDESWHTFLYAREIARWSRRGGPSDSAVGQPLRVPQPEPTPANQEG